MNKKKSDLEKELEITAQVLERKYSLLIGLARETKDATEGSLGETFNEIKHKLSLIKRAIEIPKLIIKDPRVQVGASFIGGAALASFTRSGPGGSKKALTGTLKKALNAPLVANYAVKDLIYYSISKFITNALQKTAHNSTPQDQDFDNNPHSIGHPTQDYLQSKKYFVEPSL